METGVDSALHYHGGRVQRKWSALLHGQSAGAFDLQALQMLAPLAGPYVAWSRYAMRPSGVVGVLNEVLEGRREWIVELGSGISTIFIGRLLAERGLGHLFSVEHDPAWADRVRRRLEDEHLAPYVTVVEAPLVAEAWDTGPWYERAALDRALADVRVELLVVDGPPAVRAETRFARYPAPIHFREAMAADCAIVLDDIGRRGEQQIVHRWEAELDRRFARRFLDGGIAVSRPVAPAGATQPRPETVRSRPTAAPAPGRR